ncbi:2-hydroxymuconic semialdehyde dehydrogenase [Neoconidiobolus thromboides FSU 785]|nr:2-hydroxymuconic semialdehyde dehydrogenase [Neoconidiobolus thromboides FSU 785]
MLDIINPGNKLSLGSISRGGEKEIELAVKSSKKALAGWGNTDRSVRSNYMRRIADLIESEKWFEKLVIAESLNSGKTYSFCKKVDIPRAVHNFRYYADLLTSWNPDQIVQNHGSKAALHYSIRKPAGIAGLISPWNLPLYLLTWKIAPCIAAGSVCICKPSEITSLTAYYLCQIIKEAGLPKGVVNIVFGLGSEAGDALIKHPSVRLISFTGGTETGKKVAIGCAPLFKKVSLELGGKNPSIILKHCDLNLAIETSAAAAFSNQGQICLCMSRVYVEASIYEQFVTGLVEYTKKNYKVNIPWDSDTVVGAMSSKQHFEKVLSYISLAKQEGGKIVCGGNSVDELNGYYIEPTIITDLSPNSRVVKEEIFGPVVAIIPYNHVNEAIQMANDTNYGLAACVFGNDIRLTRKVAQSIEAGLVWVNCWLVRDTFTPFGGYKDSGIGREGGFLSLDFFSEITTITLAD